MYWLVRLDIGQGLGLLGLFISWISLIGLNSVDVYLHEVGKLRKKVIQKLFNF